MIRTCFRFEGVYYRGRGRWILNDREFRVNVFIVMRVFLWGQGQEEGERSGSSEEFFVRQGNRIGQDFVVGRRWFSGVLVRSCCGWIFVSGGRGWAMDERGGWDRQGFVVKVWYWEIFFLGQREVVRRFGGGSDIVVLVLDYFILLRGFFGKRDFRVQ